MQSVGSGALSERTGPIRAIISSALMSQNAPSLLPNKSSAVFEFPMETLVVVIKVIEASQRDPLGNMRIPYLEKLPSYNPTRPFDWVEMPVAEVTTYESLVGISVRGVPLGDVRNMTFQLSAVCSTLQVCNCCITDTTFTEPSNISRCSVLRGTIQQSGYGKIHKG